MLAIVLQNHGPAHSDAALLDEQLTMFRGACNPECTDVQFAVHLPVASQTVRRRAAPRRRTRISSVLHHIDRAAQAMPSRKSARRIDRSFHVPLVQPPMCATVIVAS